ncbi:hypothetical protein BZA77DRAFT_297913 [Pyronema omphalodes]|nr:hypothetical protein BZA77DRAFT_297913 [Pyronema omphalodes]
MKSTSSGLLSLLHHHIVSSLLSAHHFVSGLFVLTTKEWRFTPLQKRHRPPRLFVITSRCSGTFGKHPHRMVIWSIASGDKFKLILLTSRPVFPRLKHCDINTCRAGYLKLSDLEIPFIVFLLPGIIHYLFYAAIIVSKVLAKNPQSAQETQLHQLLQLPYTARPMFRTIFQLQMYICIYM